MRLKGKTALITGSSRNIGKHIALAFAAEGADIVVNTRSNQDELEAAAAECSRLGARVLSHLADVSVAEQAQGLVAAALEHFEKIDILVSNAAVRPHTPLLDLTVEEWHHVMSVNLHAAFYLCKAALPAMVEQRSGSIIALGGGYTVQPNSAAVAASKLGLDGLIRVIASEYGPHGIRANLVVPGSIETERRYPEWYSRGGQGPHGGADLGRTPLRRRGMPEEVASACLFLASDESSYVTGSHLWCTGGSRTGP